MRKIPRLKKKALFGITSLLFIFYMLFLDQYSLLITSADQNRLNHLLERKEYYLNKIKNDKERLNELKTNKENLEKFAREQFFMKNKDEDIYIIKEE